MEMYSDHIPSFVRNIRKKAHAVEAYFQILSLDFNPHAVTHFLCSHACYIILATCNSVQVAT